MQRNPEEPEHRELSGRRLLIGAEVVLALIGLAAVLLAEVHELRGAAAYARFCYFGRLADRPGPPLDSVRAIYIAASEVEMLADFCRRDPFALRDAAKACLRWSAVKEMMILMRYRLKETSVELMGLAAIAAPSDYVAWLWLARALAANGLDAQADRCFNRCMELVPPGMKLDYLHNAIRTGQEPGAPSEESEKDERRP